MDLVRGKEGNLIHEDLPYDYAGIHSAESEEHAFEIISNKKHSINIEGIPKMIGSLFHEPGNLDAFKAALVVEMKKK